MKRNFLFFFVLIISSQSTAVENIKKPKILLAKTYNSNINLKNYWISEKLDGVRAYWNGKQLISRQGNVFNAPEWFIKVLPKTALDGELWIGRGRFEELSGLVRRKNPVSAEWRGVAFMVFDLPASLLPFNQRLEHLRQLISDINAKHVRLVKQFKVETHEALQKQLATIVKQGAEGLMLHAGTSLYKSGRHDDLLKLKQYADAEAIVIKQLPGKGKYKGMLGAILVETVNKKRFKIGTGFTDAERSNPPKIGSLITFKYFGFTKNGIPRFASFMRVREKY